MEACSKRGIERQKLLELIHQKLRDAEEDVGVDGTDLDKLQEYYGNLVVIVTSYTGDGGPGRYQPSKGCEMFHQMSQHFTLQAAPLIKEFSRAPEEEKALLAELAKWVMNTFAGRYEHELRKMEIQ